jgi:hypothetical protein
LLRGLLHGFLLLLGGRFVFRGVGLRWCLAIALCGLGFAEGGRLVGGVDRGAGRWACGQKTADARYGRDRAKRYYGQLLALGDAPGFTGCGFGTVSLEAFGPRFWFVQRRTPCPETFPSWGTFADKTFTICLSREISRGYARSRPFIFSDSPFRLFGCPFPVLRGRLFLAHLTESLERGSVRDLWLPYEFS